jgi:hypothetical protein
VNQKVNPYPIGASMDVISKMEDEIREVCQMYYDGLITEVECATKVAYVAIQIIDKGE